ncbi:septal ring lytic transglycosylase RlpA family protein [Desulfovibrio sp. OttesenSCG-928-C14]|nr:septal ring lytic transglycosylase RlpA family protein [Desulfovibrio sp. OttesenSCG-928-C14]
MPRQKILSVLSMGRKFAVLAALVLCLVAAQGCQKKVLTVPPSSGGKQTVSGPVTSTPIKQPSVGASSGQSQVIQGASASKRGTTPYTVLGKTYYPLTEAGNYVEEGLASWYGQDFHGKQTANGERYNMHDLTAAHKILPFGTIVRVTNLDNGRSVDMRINDRGPFIDGRIIDLSYAGAQRLDMLSQGTVKVRVKAMGSGGVVVKEDEFKGNFYIQVGSFTQESNASGLRTRLVSDGLNARSVFSSDVQSWRVQIGPYSSLGAAEEMAGKLRDSYPNSFIIVD